MRGVAGDEHPAVAVAVGEQQVLLPLADIERLELQRHADGLREHAHHVLVAVDDGMQREMLGGVLHDHLRRVVVGDVIVPSLADRDAVEQLLAVMQRLAQLQHPVFVAGKLDAELLAHHAGAAVAADEIGRGDLRGLAGEVLHRRRDAVRILAERQQFMAEAHRNARQRLRHRFQERLERVLRDQLIGLERQRAVVGRRDLRLERRHRRIFLMQERRVDHVREHDEHVHRDVAPAAPPRECGRPVPCAGRFPWSARWSAPSWAGTAAPPSAREGRSECRACRDRPRASSPSVRRRK